MLTEEDRVYEALSSALLLGKLPPGTQLVETRIANLFGVSRERVRKVLQRLGHERLIELIARRGAFVSEPSLLQAREIYEARRIVEGGIAARLAGHLTPAQCAALEWHQQRESDAAQAGDRVLSMHLSSEFHYLLASFCANPFVTRQLQELISRIVMLEALFVAEPGIAASCACEEHGQVAHAILRGDASAAAKAMHVHLSMVETRLRPYRRASPRADLDTVLRTAWEQASRAGSD